MLSARFSALICLTLFLAVCCQPAIAGAADRVTVNFDRDWRFHLGDVENGQNADFNDSSWRLLDVPHDWSIEGPFDQHSPAGAGGGYLDGGIGWYRKTFATPADAKGRRVTIEFDGVYMDSDVWLNGKHLGRHPYGYTSFHYDLTAALKPEGQNVLAVRANVAAAVQPLVLRGGHFPPRAAASPQSGPPRPLGNLRHHAGIPPTRPM